MLDRLNSMSTGEARESLLECCGSQAWAARLLAARPFETADALLDAADRAWEGLTRADRLEAFRAHPRIGERRAVDGSDRAAHWSAQEQATASGAADDVRTALAAANADYERRFGHIFIVCAAGKSAEAMLALLGARLSNDPDVELEIAAEEQRTITRLRLEQLIHRK